MIRSAYPPAYYDLRDLYIARARLAGIAFDEKAPVIPRIASMSVLLHLERCGRKKNCRLCKEIKALPNPPSEEEEDSLWHQPGHQRFAAEAILLLGLYPECRELAQERTWKLMRRVFPYLFPIDSTTPPPVGFLSDLPIEGPLQ